MGRFKYSAGAALMLCMPWAAYAGPQDKSEAARYDLILKGGHILDPANGIDAVLDIAVAHGKVAAVQRAIPGEFAEKVVDVSGLFVTPGLIDIHVHIGNGGAPLNWFDPEARSHEPAFGIPADLALQSGVTTIVDAGSSGAETFLQEKEEVIDHATVRVLAFLNIVANGMNGGLEQSVDEMDPKRCAATVNKYPELIVGVKTAHYWPSGPWDGEHTPWVAVDRALECAALANRPVMFDFWPRPDRTYAQLILEKARPGDIHTHVFGETNPIILESGKLNPIMTQARARGVKFDVGHGSGSFWFRNAVPAVQQGFIPDSISTDLHTSNMTILSMTEVISKFLSMGVPLKDLITRSTVNPANEIRHPELGSLSIGREADIAVLQEVHGRFGFADCGFARMNGDSRINALMTIRAGRIVFDPSGLSMVDWTKARKRYYTPPTFDGDPSATADDFPRN